MSSDGDYSTAKESQFDDTSSIFSDATSRHGVPSSRPGRTTNTGPKGVRADARAYEASKRDLTVINKLKNMMNRKSVAESVNESGSDADEDKWMSRWREQRMKELSKTGVAGVNLFGQVDDVDARGYLAAVDYENSDSPDDNPVAAKRIRARRNVVSVVLIYHNVWLWRVVNDSLPIQRVCFSCFRVLRDDILQYIFYGCRRRRRRICRLHRFQQS
jgi:hypothetical protein